MKVSKVPQNREVVTGVVARVEMVVYNERGQVANRRLVDIGVIEADIPDQVRVFLAQQVKKADAATKPGG